MSMVNQGDPHEAAEPFDPTFMLERIDGNMRLFAELVEIFHEDYPPLLGEIRQAIAENDADRLKLAAHTLSGAIGNFTVASPYDLAKQLETVARTKDLSGTQTTLGLLVDGVDQLAAALTRCVSESVS